ncbi:type II secretion system F family protein [Thalassobacillus hwangdonensis]|uniref:Type II secretion system F family protein n=1 Tax=Thalassobacillus hwangdonensis TaxID=546108 RepID=A0ABW3L2A7_9BACI
MIYIFFFFTISLLIYGLVVFKAEKKQKVNKRVSSIFEKESHQSSVEDKSKKTSKSRIISSLLTQLKRSFKTSISNEKRDRLERKLQRAGNPFGMGPVEFRILQFVFIVVVPFVGFGYSLVLGLPGGAAFLIVIVSFLLAIYLPDYILKKKAKVRSYLSTRELPDFLDLLTVSLEAGLGFDGAISKVVSKKEGVLADEFRRCLEEIRLGKTRRQALNGITDRLLNEDVRSLIGSVNQAEKLGIGMVQVLRVQSNEVRDTRKQKAEEEAMKAPVKMLFPLVIFIFPSLFIILLGPAVIQFVDAF